MRKVFLDDLSTKIYGKTNRIDWIYSIGCKVKFIYDDIEGYVEIVGYDGKYLYIKYLDKKPFKIITGNFQKCQLGKLLDKHTNEFKVEIGEIFKDDKRDIVITDRKQIESPYRKGTVLKYYKYRCNKCGFECGEHYDVTGEEFKKELWITENHLKSKEGCSCCASKLIVRGINDIPTTDPWMIKYFVNKEDSNIFFAKSNKKIEVKCPDCEKIKIYKISDIYKNKSISCSCGDKKSYSEKLMFDILNQLDVNFTTQKSFEWCKKINHKNIKLCGNKKYDFYFKLNNEEYIIETHGSQHYTKSFSTISSNAKTLEEEKENDIIGYTKWNKRRQLYCY